MWRIKLCFGFGPFVCLVAPPYAHIYLGRAENATDLFGANAKGLAQDGKRTDGDQRGVRILRLEPEVPTYFDQGASPQQRHVQNLAEGEGWDLLWPFRRPSFVLLLFLGGLCL